MRSHLNDKLPSPLVSSLPLTPNTSMQRVPKYRSWAMEFCPMAHPLTGP